MKTKIKLPWREAGPPNHLGDEVDLDQLSMKHSLALHVVYQWGGLSHQSGFNELSRDTEGAIYLGRVILKNIEALPSSRKVDIRLPKKGNSNSHGARPVY